jgi:hypothetical protein
MNTDIKKFLWYHEGMSKNQSYLGEVMKQEILLCVLAGALLAFASWSHAAYTKCTVLDGSDFEGGTLIIQCDPEATKEMKAGDIIKGKKVKPVKAYEGC